MIAGALEFTLGLEANKFLGELGLAGGKLLSFLGVTSSIESAFHKMWDAVEKGGHLYDLAVGAHTSVASLYQLQTAFEQIGASADSAAPLIKKMQRTLADNEGRDALRSIGLDPEQLKGKEAVDQIESVADALGKLTVTRQTASAFQLFGREGGNTMLQAARSGADFKESIKATRSDAEIWNRVAKTFDHMADKVLEIKRHVETMWALLAGTLAAAFQSGQIPQVIADTFSTGFSMAVDLFPGFALKISETLMRALMTPVTYLSAGLDYVLDHALNNPAVSKLIDMLPGTKDIRDSITSSAPGQPADFATHLERSKFFASTAINGVLNPAGSDILSKGLASAGQELSDWQKRMGDIFKLLPAGSPQEDDQKKSEPFFKPEVTSLEKMGFVFNGSHSASDHARRTAENTQQTVRELKLLNEQMAKGSREERFSHVP